MCLNSLFLMETNIFTYNRLKYFNSSSLYWLKGFTKKSLCKINGNKSEFAKASNCSGTTVRRVFRNEQRMTVDLFLRFCFALNKNINEIFEGIDILNK